MRKLILASTSPRRKEILELGKLQFNTVKSNYQEESFEFYDESFIKKNSLYKAQSVAKSTNGAATVIGADTMVILGSVCLLKPACHSKAFFMLKNLSGKTHKVVTSISLVDTITGKNLTEIEETFVTFRELADKEIEEYIEKFNPLDKAGSYGIQDFIGPNEASNPPKESFVQKLEGDYYNVMGISLNKLLSMLEKFELGL